MRRHEPYDAIIIGGGMAGLSAAVELARTTRRILVLEQRRHFGGRTYSYIDATTGDAVDNGQHLLMGCYTQTLRYLKSVGSEHLASMQPRLHIEFLRPGRERVALTSGWLPAPLHVLAGLLRLRSLSMSNRIRLIKVGLSLLWTTEQKERRLESVTVDQWLTELGQPTENKQFLWNIIAVGSLNDDPKTVAALLFFRVLRAAFFGSNTNSSLLVPNVGLSELLVKPGLLHLTSRGCDIRQGCSVDRIVVDGSSVARVECSDGSSYSGRSFIVAVPHTSFASLETVSRGRSKLSAAAEALIRLQRSVTENLKSSPIVTINLWFDRKVVDVEFAALLEGHAQWVFNKSAMDRHTSPATTRQHLAMVISGAGEYVELTKERLVRMAREELENVAPGAREAKLLHSVVVKEKRATFSPRPGTEAYRPQTRTPLQNLFLAGDWTSTGFPATIEGAVISGFKAAEYARSLL